MSRHVEIALTGSRGKGHRRPAMTYSEVSGVCSSCRARDAQSRTLSSQRCACAVRPSLRALTARPVHIWTLAFAVA